MVTIMYIYIYGGCENIYGYDNIEFLNTTISHY